MQAKIVIIDDILQDHRSLIFKLKEKFGEENVLTFDKSKEGLDYLMKNYENSKMIVILDWNLGSDQIQGFDVFKKMQDKTSLIHFIFVSGVQLSTISNEKLLDLINYHAFYFFQKTTSYTKIFDKVVEVSHLLETRLDCALEDWITMHSPEDREKPYLMTLGGKTHTLNDLLHEIRKKTELGMRMERNILQLTIDLLSRQRQKTND